MWGNCRRNWPPSTAQISNVQEMAVRGIVENDKTKVFQSILLDPLTSAVLTIDETRIWSKNFSANAELRRWK